MAMPKDFSLALEMTIRESNVSWSLSHKSLEISNPQSLIPSHSFLVTSHCSRDSQEDAKNLEQFLKKVYN